MEVQNLEDEQMDDLTQDPVNVNWQTSDEQDDQDQRTEQMETGLGFTFEEEKSYEQDFCEDKEKPSEMKDKKKHRKKDKKKHKTKDKKDKKHKKHKKADKEKAEKKDKKMEILENRMKNDVI